MRRAPARAAFGGEGGVGAGHNKVLFFRLAAPCDGVWFVAVSLWWAGAGAAHVFRHYLCKYCC